MRKWKWIWVYLNMWRVLPVYLIMCSCKHREKTAMDFAVWQDRLFRGAERKKGKLAKAGWCLLYHREFVSLLLNRLHRNPIMYAAVRVLFRPLDSLYIKMPPEKIGGGLYIQHGFSTILTAERIGEYCSVYQQVTVGYHGAEQPVIGDHVTVCAGAIVIGGVSIGDHAVVGAGAVVTKSADAYAVLAGVPAEVIKYRSPSEDADR